MLLADDGVKNFGTELGKLLDDTAMDLRDSCLLTDLRALSHGQGLRGT